MSSAQPQVQEGSVAHPRYYNVNPSGIECIEVTRWFNFNRGNAIKYIWRAGNKGTEEDEIKDLRKALWYINDEIQRIQEGGKGGYGSKR